MNDSYGLTHRLNEDPFENLFYQVKKWLEQKPHAKSSPTTPLILTIQQILEPLNSISYDLDLDKLLEMTEEMHQEQLIQSAEHEDLYESSFVLSASLEDQRCLCAAESEMYKRYNSQGVFLSHFISILSAKLSQEVFVIIGLRLCITLAFR